MTTQNIHPKDANEAVEWAEQGVLEVIQPNGTYTEISFYSSAVDRSKYRRKPEVQKRLRGWVNKYVNPPLVFHESELAAEAMLGDNALRTAVPMIEATPLVLTEQQKREVLSNLRNYCLPDSCIMSLDEIGFILSEFNRLLLEEGK